MPLSLPLPAGRYCSRHHRWAPGGISRDFFEGTDASGILDVFCPCGTAHGYNHPSLNSWVELALQHGIFLQIQLVNKKTESVPAIFTNTQKEANDVSETHHHSRWETLQITVVYLMMVRRIFRTSPPPGRCSAKWSEKTGCLWSDGQLIIDIPPVLRSFQRSESVTTRYADFSNKTWSLKG